MTYTIVSAVYANPEHTAAVVQTRQAGAVALSADDNPDEWASLLEWGAAEDYDSPVAPIPVITRRQLRLWLFSQGKSLEDVKAFIEAMPEPSRSIALIEMEDAGTFERSHALFDLVGPTLGFTPEEMDQGFREAALL